MGASMTRWTTRVLPTVALAGAVLLGGCQSTGTPTAPAASTGADAAATSPAPTTSGAPTASSASSPGTPLEVFEVTCHTGPGVTASGRPSSREVVSVDRRLFPFGTRLFIDQVGLRVAADTGPAMVGRRLDIWEPSAAACAKFGRKRLKVWQAP
jgi:3D (Asp-Asp-Asp) domain-containing protein